MTGMYHLKPNNGRPPLLLKAALGPALLLQGLWVRLRTPRLPEADGPRRGQTGAGPRLRLLVLGDSSAAGVGVAWQSEALLGQLTRALGRHYTVAYRLEARTGATTADALDTLARPGMGPCDVVVTALGVNDLTAGRKTTAWLCDQQRLIDRLHTRLKPRLILISGLPPVHLFPALPQPLRWYLGAGARAFSTGLKLLAEANGALFLPLDFTLDISQMATDGFHPGRGVYREWGRRAAAGIHTRLEAQLAAAPVRLRDGPEAHQAPENMSPAAEGQTAASAGNLHPGKEFDPCPDC